MIWVSDRCAWTEEHCFEYLIMKDIPQRVWRDYDKANKPRLVICKYNQLQKQGSGETVGKYQRVGEVMSKSRIVDKDGNIIDQSS